MRQPKLFLAADDGLALDRALGETEQPASAGNLIGGSAATAWCPSEPGSPAVIPTRA